LCNIINKLKKINRTLILAVVWQIKRHLYLFILKKRDILFTTYKEYKSEKYKLNYLSISNIDTEAINVDTAKVLWENYREHNFDLLGSGWINTNYNTKVTGFENYRYDNQFINLKTRKILINETINERNISESISIFNLLDKNYCPIDWQRDFKSGYRWTTKDWFSPPIVGPQKGVDIKVPWELGRLQHLPRFAILYKMIPEEQKEIKAEFQNQLIDFIAQNPIRWGVNYMCTMDVGIRTANIVLAISLFKSQGINFDDKFEAIVMNYIYGLCDFIFHNLEWSYYLTSNHYFANIAGLLFGAAILPKDNRQKKWLKFSIAEVKREILKQYNVEGSNKEGSTAYHRLTSEMALYSVALIHKLSLQGYCEDCSSDIKNIIYKTGKFLDSITRPDGEFTQIGDNDSGLFFRLSITGQITETKEILNKYHNLSKYYSNMNNISNYLDENMNDGRTFLSAVAGLFDSKDFQHVVMKYPLEASIVTSICQEKITLPDVSKKEIIIANAMQLKELEKREFKKYTSNQDLLHNIKYEYFSEFGVIIFKSDNLYLVINVTDNGQNGNAGHAHNDKLSYELFIENICKEEDPGVYVYSADAELRNLYRSTCAHNTLYFGVEQNNYNGMFSMINETNCSVLFLNSCTAEVCVEYKDILHIRRFEILSHLLIITDYVKNEAVNCKINLGVSRGYGKVEKFIM